MLSSFADRAGELLAFAVFAGMLFAAVMAGGMWWAGASAAAMLGRATARGADLDAATAHVSALMSAAGQIQGAAARALASMSRPEVSALDGDVRREVVAVSAGIASAVGDAGTRPLPQRPVRAA